MIDHVSVAVKDLAKATQFYETLLASIGIVKMESRPETVGFGKTYPEFWINLCGSLPAMPPESGAHICFRAQSTELVDAFHSAALVAGGSSDGAPG